MRRSQNHARVARFVPGLLFVVGVVTPAVARGQVASPPGGPDTLIRAEGKRVAGRFVGDLKGGFRLDPADGSAAIAIVGPAEVVLGGKGPGPGAGVPPVQVVLGMGQSVSGGLAGVDAGAVRLSDGPGGRPVSVDRRGALALRQRPGEASVLTDGFEAIDPARWGQVGTPKVVSDLKLAGEKSLAIAADGSAVTAGLAEPVAQGRLEVAFHDSATVVAGATWFVDLLFKGEQGPESLRAVLGWAEESHAVQSSGGPALAVQRLARKPGWHRLEVRFGPESAEMAVDGDALAHGKGPTGPLVEVRIGSSIVAKEPVAGLLAHVDELRVVRTASPASPGEADPAQDEVRLLEGDQVFGAIQSADASRVVVAVLDRPVSLPWSGVASIAFRRDPRPSRVVDGLLVRLDWRSAPGDDPRDLDRAEGALVSADDRAFTLETPYAGTLVIPRDRLRRAEVEGLGRRTVIDPTAHHLGDEVSKTLDPPQPEGGVLSLAFTLDRPPGPGEAASLVLDVVQVVGEANGLQFAPKVREGELRTKVALNGREFDYLNRHIIDGNDTPERIRLPIPPGLLKAGENRLVITQTGTANDPTFLDDLGILGIAVDVVPSTRPAAAVKP